MGHHQVEARTLGAGMQSLIAPAPICQSGIRPAMLPTGVNHFVTRFAIQACHELAQHERSEVPVRINGLRRDALDRHMRHDER